MTEHEKWLETYRDKNASPDELNAILGKSWAICRKTPNNLARYARCLSPKEYAAAEAKAIAARPKDMDRLTRDLAGLVAKYSMAAVASHLARLTA